jgi:precorrin-2 methylase
VSTTTHAGSASVSVTSANAKAALAAAAQVIDVAVATYRVGNIEARILDVSVLAYMPVIHIGPGSAERTYYIKPESRTLTVVREDRTTSVRHEEREGAERP